MSKKEVERLDALVTKAKAMLIAQFGKLGGPCLYGCILVESGGSRRFMLHALQPNGKTGEVSFYVNACGPTANSTLVEFRKNMESVISSDE